MAYWLLKTEPEEFSWTDQVKKSAKGEVWSGVRNFVARDNLRAMKKGEFAFFYHTGKEKAIIGTATVSKVAYPDPKDRRASLSVVELAVGKALARPVTLAEIKADKRFADMPLVRIARQRRELERILEPEFSAEPAQVVEKLDGFRVGQRMNSTLTFAASRR